MALVASAAALEGPLGPLSDHPLTAWKLFSTAATGTVYDVRVPCTVVGCLVEAGAFDFDPFYGKNIFKIDKARFAVPWTFTTTFDAPAGATATGAKTILYLHGVNYRGNLTLNGVVVADSSVLVGALRRFEFDVTPHLRATGNTLTVTLQRPHDDPHNWRNNGTDLSVSFDDWNPHPPDLSMGLWRPVGLRVIAAGALAPVTFDGLVVDTQLSRSAEEDGTGDEVTVALLNVSVAVRNWGNTVQNVKLYVDLGAVTFGSMKFELDVSLPAGGETRAVWCWTSEHRLIVEQPPLWWPWQMMENRQRSSLFNATVGVVNASSAATSPAVPYYWWRYGLRETSKKLTAGGALQFYINGLPLMLRSGGWAPDMFLRDNTTRLRYDFAMVRDMGLNAVRLEGQMMNAEFFDLADEVGFLITPGLGCCDGWQHWARWPAENYHIAAESIRDQARRLGTHPAVLAFLESSDELPPPDVESIYNDVFAQEAWPNPLVSSASQQPSTLTGISGIKMVGPYSWVPPNYWLIDGSGLLGNGTMNYGGAWGFLTEGGPGESPMTMDSWKRTVPAEHLWNETTKSMDSWWSAHMGCPYGHFRNLTFYTPPLDARYGSSNSAATYLYRAQAANFEGIRAMYEGYNRNKHINATGVVQWQIKMAWPSHLWNLYDWYFVGGGGFYGAKRAHDPVHVMLSYNDGSVWIYNSRFEDFFEPINVTSEVMLLDGTVVRTRSTVLEMLPSDGSLHLADVDVPLDGGHAVGETDTFLVRLTWTSRLYQLPQKNWYWLSPKFDIPGPWAASNSFRTPCAQWANFGQLNSLPRSNVTADVTNLGMRTPTKEAAADTTVSVAGTHVLGTIVPTFQVRVKNEGTHVAFFMQLRPHNRTSGHDVAPAFFTDNFFSLAPGEDRTVYLEVPDQTFEALEHVTLVVDTYNDVVANAHAGVQSTAVPLVARTTPKAPRQQPHRG